MKIPTKYSPGHSLASLFIYQRPGMDSIMPPTKPRHFIVEKNLWSKLKQYDIIKKITKGR